MNNTNPRPSTLYDRHNSPNTNTRTLLVHRYRFATRAEACRAALAWINRYNTRRRHSSLRYVPPIEWETDSRQTVADQVA